MRSVFRTNLAIKSLHVKAVMSLRRVPGGTPMTGKRDVSQLIVKVNLGTQNDAATETVHYLLLCHSLYFLQWKRCVQHLNVNCGAVV